MKPLSQLVRPNILALQPYSPPPAYSSRAVE